MLHNTDPNEPNDSFEISIYSKSREMSGLYRRVIGQIDQIVNRSFPSGPVNNLWHHEAGPKTIFFWAPLWKWTIVIAGIADLARPAHR